MAAYNYFGATSARLLALYPSTAAADFGGSPAILDALARISREVSGAFTNEVYRCLAETVELELVEDYAADGQTTVTLGLLPIVTGSVHLWRFGQLDELSRRPVLGQDELTATVNTSTGVATLTTALSLGDKVFATYEINPEDATFSWPSVADVVLLGAAAELGARIYSQADQVWALVSEYQDRYRGKYVVQEGGVQARSRAGTWVPDELRTLRWWTEIERSQPEGGIGSVRRYRA